MLNNEKLHFLNSENISGIAVFACRIIRNSGGQLRCDAPALADLKFAEDSFRRTSLDLPAVREFCAAFAPVKLISNEQARAVAKYWTTRYVDLQLAEAENRLEALDYAGARNACAEANAPLEELAGLGGADAAAKGRKKIAAMAAAVEGLEMLARAERIYAKQKLERGEAASLSSALYCLDLLAEAKRRTRGCSVNELCRVKVLQGKIQLYNLLNRKWIWDMNCMCSPALRS